MAGVSQIVVPLGFIRLASLWFPFKTSQKGSGVSILSHSRSPPHRSEGGLLSRTSKLRGGASRPKNEGLEAKGGRRMTRLLQVAPKSWGANACV